MMEKAISTLSDLFTIAASGIAIWIFLAKGKEFRALFTVLTNFAHQSSLGELRQKLESLNNLNANDAADNQEVTNILHDICGHIEGNPLFRSKLDAFSTKVKKATLGKRRITEPQKRFLVSELREGLRHMDTKNLAQVLGD